MKEQLTPYVQPKQKKAKKKESEIESIKDKHAIVGKRKMKKYKKKEMEERCLTTRLFMQIVISNSVSFMSLL